MADPDDAPSADVPAGAASAEALLAEVALGLVQLAELGRGPHVTRVAARTGVSQPTLSRAMVRWERALGVDLFARSGRELVLTPEGERLADLAVEAVQLLRRGTEDVLGGSRAAVLSIGLLRSLGPTIGSELVAAFHRASPGVRLEEHEAGSTALLTAMAESRLDLALLAPPPPGRYGWQSLGRQAFALVVPRRHALATTPGVGLRDAAGEPFLTLHPGYTTREMADRLCADAGFTPRVILEAHDVATVRNYVADGMGVAILPHDVIHDPRVVPLPTGSTRAWREIGLAWPLDGRLSVAGQTFLDTAAEMGRRFPGWADLTLAD